MSISRTLDLSKNWRNAPVKQQLKFFVAKTDHLSVLSVKIE